MKDTNSENSQEKGKKSECCNSKYVLCRDYSDSVDCGKCGKHIWNDEDTTPQPESEGAVIIFKDESNGILLTTEKQYQTSALVREVRRGNVDEFKEIIVIPDWVIQCIRNGKIKS